MRISSSVAGSRSRARTYRLPAKALGSTESAPACGERCDGWFARYDRDTCSWRTPQYSLFGGLTEYSGTWPKWGMMRSGVCWERTTLERRTFEKGYGYWPTPRANDAEKRGNFDLENPRNGLAAAAKKWPTPRSSDGTHGGRVTPRKAREGGNLIEAVSKEMFPTPNKRDWKDCGPTQGNRKTPNLGTVVVQRKLEFFRTPQVRDYRTGERRRFENRQQKNLNDQLGGQLNPTWVGWLMGLPHEWTALKPLEMRKFRRWLRLHGMC